MVYHACVVRAGVGAFATKLVWRTEAAATNWLRTVRHSHARAKSGPSASRGPFPSDAALAAGSA